MNDFPLNAFLDSLAADGFILSARDYNRLLLTFQTGEDWTISRLKNVLTALLAKNEDQQRIIQRRFDKFFQQETGCEKQIPDFDIQRVLNDLKSFDPKPCPVPDQSGSVHIPEDDQTVPSYKPKKFRKKYAWLILACIALVIIAFIGIRMVPYFQFFFRFRFPVPDRCEASQADCQSQRKTVRGGSRTCHRCNGSPAMPPKVGRLALCFRILMQGHRTGIRRPSFGTQV
ncbi:MAG: hypothetical protein GY795_14090 [Desulfobacterales bacterium]|nr:hypothetical protein [Desulfobacterales bacterium]